uniref:Serine/threonine-protein kinase SAPK2 isoform X2 n=1 Tax=Rhizophora mucronata TaxID=61149 RepID=A0A2P2IZ31_RHIMU
MTSELWHLRNFPCLLYYSQHFFNALRWVIDITTLPASTIHELQGQVFQEPGMIFDFRNGYSLLRVCYKYSR